jgi:putative peptidoglycan lipid II flippase
MGGPPAPVRDVEFSLRRLGRSAGLLAIAGVLGQVISVTRELFIANQVGASSGLDAVLIAITPPLVVAGIISSGVRAALVPAYVDTETRLGTIAARTFLGALLTWVALIGLAATATLMLVPVLAVTIAGPGLDLASRAMAADYMRIAAPLLLVVTMTNVLSGVCQIHDQFTPIAIALVVGPIAALGATVLLWPALQLGSLPVALVAGETTSVLALVLVAGRAGMLPRPRLSFATGDIGAFLRHVGPLAAGSAILQFNLLSDRAIATLIGAGSVSALRYGQQLVVQPLGALTMAWGTVLYPTIVRRALDRVEDLGGSLERALRASIALATPAAVWMAGVAPLVVELVYRRGAFDSSDVSVTTAVVIGFAPMIALGVVQPVLIGAHNARRRATLLGAVAFANAALNIVLNIVFGVVLGVGGIALSSSLTLFILLAFLATRIYEPGFDLGVVVKYAIRSLAAAALAVTPTLAVVPLIPSGLGIALAPIVAGLGLSMAALYPVVASRLGVTEPMLVMTAMWARASRRG